MSTTPLPPLPTNTPNVTRRIRACESEVPAQVVLEHALHAYAQQARADLEAENQRLREAIDHAEKVLSRQLDLISDRARGEYLDKRPVVSALSQHRKQLRAALKGTP